MSARPITPPMTPPIIGAEFGVCNRGAEDENVGTAEVGDLEDTNVEVIIALGNAASPFVSKENHGLRGGRVIEALQSTHASLSPPQLSPMPVPMRAHNLNLRTHLRLPK
jgi:hypothetical protein